MPKRVPTPPPGDDEPKYLTVVQPFPLAGHWEIPEDRKEFARWIACCIGTEPFYAFFYKPRAAMSMVILEVERTYDHFNGVLGEHRWSEFLKDPNGEERNRVSQVFHCLYKSDREAQKDGWKRINVEDAWFKDWSPSDWRVMDPYPPTHWCAVPKEDRTNKPLCRPLPVRTFPPPMKAAPPVVGSSDWIDTKSAPSQNTPKASRTAWGKPAGSLVISTRDNKPQPTAKKNASPHPATPSSTSSSRNRSLPSSAATPSFWASPTSPIPMDYPSPASSLQSPTFPPGLGPKPTRRPSNSAWGHATSPTSHTTSPIPPGFTRNDCSSGNSGDSGSSLPASLTSNENLNLKTRAKDITHIQMLPGMENSFYGMALQESPVPGSGYVAPWEQPEPSEAGPEPRWEQNEPEAIESLWDDYDAPTRGPEPILCKAHGVICKKGICLEYDKQMKEIDRAARVERGDTGEKGTGKGAKGKEKGARMVGRKSSNFGKAGNTMPSITPSRGGWDSQSTCDNKNGWGNEGSAIASGSGSYDDENAEGKSSIGRMRAFSDSKAESVARVSNDGWDDASNGPW